MKFALMGYGLIGKVHEAALQQAQNASLEAIIDTAQIQTDLPVFDSIQGLRASDIQVDAIIIATPNGLHFEHARQALENDFHAVVEKPITLSSKDFERLIFIAESKKRRVFNMLQLRFAPIPQWVKKALNDKLFGQVYMVNVQCYWNRNAAYYQQREWHGTREMDGGVLFTQFSHFVDVLHYWFEELKPKDIRSFNFNHQDSTEFPDSGIINFEITHGFGSMVYTISTFEKNFDSNITIIAEKATLQIGGQYMNQINYFNAENVENPFSKETEKRFHKQALEEIATALTNNRSSILDAENARNVIRFLETVS
ncbi:MAG: Gfo/Idh/MocA family oxidoreductase [Flavobacteriaceae bacterium]|nr:Gfo/Idh/MocA family oxidoreductase [Flavobacteriaceae bacterium]